ncbi:hypothetical protein K501DRAFT_278712 [Backusella circina FSU 941]|nr:hypothetical protein K501DRAFT_278712 [Backusella circina FSU 941]
MPIGKEFIGIYSTGYPGLLQGVQSQLEPLRLSSTLDRDFQVIRTLGTLDFQIKNLDMCLYGDMCDFDALAKISSYKYIENLELYEVDVDVYFHKLKEIPNLKILAISFMELNTFVIFNENQTQEIETYTERIKIDMNQSFRQLSTSFESVMIEQFYAKFDNHFLNLHSLTIWNSFETGDSIMLPNHHFIHLQVSKYPKELNARLVTKDKAHFFGAKRRLKKPHAGIFTHI